MKRTLPAIILLILVLSLFTGCAGKREAAELDRWRRSLAGQEIRFTAEIETPDGTAFTAEVCRREDTELRLLAPDTIRDVRVRVKAGSRELVYEDLVLVLPPEREGEDSPCAGPGRVLDAVLTGDILWTGREITGPTAEFSLSEGETVLLWRDESGAPIRAELCRDGRTGITIAISDWQTKEN